MISLRELSYNYCPQLTRIFLGILANLDNAAFWIMSIRPMISNSSSPLNKPSSAFPSALFTIIIKLP